MKLAIRITRCLYFAYGLAAGCLCVYVGLNAYGYVTGAWLHVAAVASIVAMVAQQPLHEWTWKTMKRRFVRNRYGDSAPAEVPVWDSHADYPARHVLTCFGLIFESAAPTGPGHGNVTSPLDDGQRIWTPL